MAEDQVEAPLRKRLLLQIELKAMDFDARVRSTLPGDCQADARNIGNRHIESAEAQPNCISPCTAGDIERAASKRQKISQANQHGGRFARRELAVGIFAIPFFAVSGGHFIAEP